METKPAKIISGAYKSKTIFFPSSLATRGTKSIVRKSLIDTLGASLRGYFFVEVFAGSGSVGLEALSNGAKGACFLEQDSQALQTLRKNLNALRIKAAVISGDSFENLPRFVAEHGGQDLWLYFDPPFNIRAGKEHIYEKTQDLIQNIDATKVCGLTIEHISSYKMPAILGEFALQKTKKFSKTSLSYYKNSERLE